MPKSSEAEKLYQREYRLRNADRLREYRRAHKHSRETQRRISAFVSQVKSVPCADCGVQYPPYVMDFDHRDPTQKIDHVVRVKTSRSRAALLAEIAKCDVVCSNCHRIRTFSKTS